MKLTKFLILFLVTILNPYPINAGQEEYAFKDNQITPPHSNLASARSSQSFLAPLESQSATNEKIRTCSHCESPLIINSPICLKCGIKKRVITIMEKLFSHKTKTKKQKIKKNKISQEKNGCRVPIFCALTCCP